MSGRERWLPLFPLNVVLFPGASLPLQVFEERYRTMLKDCLAGDGTFGVALIRQGSEVGEPALPYATGTTARPQQVRLGDGGRLFLVVRGLQRFRIREVTQLRPYMAAQVELLEEQEAEGLGSEDLTLLKETATRYIRLVAGLQGGWVRDVPFPEDPVALSYFVADTLQVGLAQKQRLLEEPSTKRRLEAEFSILARETRKLRRRVAHQLLHRRFSLQ